MTPHPPAPLPFYCDCVHWDQDDVRAPGGLCDMIDAAVSITRRTLMARVDKRDLRSVEVRLGYERDPRLGLTMKNDFHVSYHKSTLHGRTVYYLVNSAIEYVFSDLPKGHRQ